MKQPHPQPLSEKRGFLAKLSDYFTPLSEERIFLHKVVSLLFSPLLGEGSGVRLLPLLLLFSCQRHVETPLQILIAETAVENNSDAQYALYLLGEVEDTIAFYPDSIQMRYRLAQAMAQNAKGEAVDSLLPPLMEWFDAHGPVKEAARVHHLAALSWLQQSRMEEAHSELSLALKADPSYKASQFLTAYLCLYTGAYTEALEHFMRSEKDKRSDYSVLQGAYALRSSLHANHSDFAQTMQGEELETARQMLTDMEFCLRYFQEHPDDDRADIIRRCAAARDSLLRSLTPQPPLGGETGEAQAKKELPLKGVGGALVVGAWAALALIAALWIMYRRRRKQTSEQQPMPVPELQPIFHEIVQRMEELADGGRQPSAEEWEQLHVFVRDRYPALAQTLEKHSLTRSEMQMCLLSAVDLRQKQVATLLGISPQNLRNQRLRLLARLGGQPCESVADFTVWIEKLRGTVMQTRLAAVLLMLCCGLTAGAQTFGEWFEDRTLRLDYVFAGDARRQELYLDQLSAMPRWYGRRTRLAELPLAGNGQITVRAHRSQQVIYRHSFSTLFQEWLATDEAKHVRRSFENVFLVPFPRDTVDVTVELLDFHSHVLTSMTHTVIPTDILISRKGERSVSPYVTLQQASDTTRCIHIAYVPEGYTTGEMTSFLDHCRTATDALFRHEPFKSLRHRFNIVALLTPSADSGVSDPGKGLWLDTALGSHFDTFYIQRYLTTLHLGRLHDLLAGTPYEHIIILANTSHYGGGGIFNSYNLSYTGGSKFEPVVVHEFGHSFGGLGDEYPNGNDATMYFPDTEPWEPNLTTLHDFSGKWQNLIDQGQAGLIEGGGYQEKGIWRGLENCRMRTNEEPDFCPVCQQALRRLIGFYTE